MTLRGHLTRWDVVLLVFILGALATTLALFLRDGPPINVTGPDNAVNESENEFATDDPVKKLAIHARSELKVFQQTGHTDWTVKYDVRTSNSLVSPLVGIIQLFDAEGECTRDYRYAWDPESKLWKLQFTAAPKADRAIRDAQQFIERYSK